MKLFFLCLLTSCSSLGLVQDVVNDIKEVETKAVVSIEIDKAAFNENQNVKINIETSRM